jgi:hypothetical protein
LAIRRGRGEAHRVDVADVGGERGGEPGAKLLERVGMKIGTAEAMRIIFVAQAGQLRNRRLIHSGTPKIMGDGRKCRRAIVPTPLPPLLPSSLVPKLQLGNAIVREALAS